MNLRPSVTGTELTLAHLGLRNLVAQANHTWGWGRALDTLEAQITFLEGRT